MLTGKPDFLDRLAQLLVLAVGLFALLFGMFMILWPLDWYTAIPTVITTGPPNKHFIRDIGIAYAACGVILLYASVNIHARWMAALAGVLWLSLHGVLHVYEVSVGICSPEVFIADAPGVLGPPLLVFVALGIIFVRQRISPAGIPKSLFLKVATAKIEESEKQYLYESNISMKSPLLLAMSLRNLRISCLHPCTVLRHLQICSMPHVWARHWPRIAGHARSPVPIGRWLMEYPKRPLIAGLAAVQACRMMKSWLVILGRPLQPNPPKPLIWATG